MRKVTYSRTFNSLEGQEVFSAVEFDSFDEAKKIVDRGINDRKTELKAKYPSANLGEANTFRGPFTPTGAAQLAPHKVGDGPSTNAPSGNQ
jgi:hypothetical protein